MRGDYPPLVTYAGGIEEMMKTMRRLAVCLRPGLSGSLSWESECNRPDCDSSENATKRRMIGPASGEANLNHLLIKVWRDDKGQDIAEYAVMLAVILVLVVGTIRLVGSNANNAFSSVASSLQ